MTRTSRAAGITALVIALVTVLAGTLSASPGHAASSPGTMVVIGDSISSGATNHVPYNNTVGSTWRAWWSFLGSSTGLRPQVHAEPGSGYTRPGKNVNGVGDCTGSTFEHRLRRSSVATRVRAASIVVLEGGYNDYHKLNPDGSCSNGTLTQAALAAQLRPYVHSTMKRMAALRKDPRTVYVTVPWGRNNRQWQATIASVIKSEAQSFGFRYVDTASTTLTSKSRTYDGTHPTLAGSRAIASVLYAAFSSQSGRVDPTTPTAPVHSITPPPVR